LYTPAKKTRPRKIRPSRRHPILVYRRWMDRLWPPTLLLGLLLAAAGGWYSFSPAPLLHTGREAWLLASGLLLLGMSLFCYLARSLAYLQFHRDHLRLVTPFLRLKISYRRVLKAHPADFIQLYPPSQAGWAQRRFMEPFYGRTAIVLELTALPLSRSLLRLFLPRQMFSPLTPGFVLLVPDWMEFSEELETRRGAWLQTQSNHKRPIISPKTRTSFW
jgi:hypothetical protein